MVKPEVNQLYTRIQMFLQKTLSTLKGKITNQLQINPFKINTISYQIYPKKEFTTNTIV